MNVNTVRSELEKCIGKNVKITVYGMRNRIDRYEGTIYKTYPNIFTIKIGNDEKSFSYRDIITKDINIRYL